MSNRPRIYLDNAATSWPKPQAVYDAVDDYQRRLGASAGRSGYAEAEEVGQAVEDARAAVARLIGAEAPERVIFTFNGTDSLNLAIHGTLRPGDHVVTTVAEHNSVLRPLRRLERKNQISVTRVGCDAAGVIDPDEIRAALRPDTKLVILTHASNVTGAIQPVAEVGRIVREHGALFLVDAAQTLGHMPVSAAALGADLLAAPGHKGLLGPLGTGILYLRRGIEQRVDCIRQGGTGSSSSSDEQPISLPEKYESGSHNALGIIGLGEGIKYIQQRGIEDIRGHATELTDVLLSGLSEIPAIEIFGPRMSYHQIGVVSFSIAGCDPLAVAKTLDEEHHIQARAGFQCAALMHRSLGTLERNGTVRFSVGPLNTETDVETAVRAVAEVATSERTTIARVSCPCVSGGSQRLEMVTPAGTEENAPSPRVTDISAIPGLQDLWKQTLGDPRICIAVLDGPVDLTHFSLRRANLTQIETLVSGEAEGGAVAEHGTHVASVIFGRHDGPVKGVAPQCRGLIAPIFTDVIDGAPLPCSQIDLARALLQALQAGANIINISGGQFSPSGTAHPVLTDAVRACVQNGVLIVAAAGNQGCDCLHIPGSLPSVLAVGAMSTDGDPLPFSNWGSAYKAQGILAPGENILGAVPGGKTSTRSGTSFATPIVTGVAALLLSLQLKRGQKPDVAAVREALLRSALGCDSQPIAECQRLLAGRLNVNGAVSIIDFGERIMPNTTTQPHSAPRMAPTENPKPSDQLLPASDLSNAVQTEPARRASSPTPTTASRSEQSRADVGMITPAACGCGAGASAPQLAYALGQLGYDLGTEARRDSFIQNMDEPAAGVSGNPYDPNQLLNYLQANPWDAASVIWTLSLDGTAIYAVMPNGPYASEAYQRLRQFLKEQLTEGVERVSIPGIIAGKVRLMNGQVVPAVLPEIRGMCSWTTQALVKAIIGGPLAESASHEDKHARFVREKSVREFLDRVYFELRNLGITPQDRAINHAGTNAFNIHNAFESAAKEDMNLDSIEVDRSPVCRPDSDCWDVKLYFFFPKQQVQTVRKVYRFTVDVSDVVPVTVGPVRSWFVR